MSNERDRELIAACLAGDPDAFGELMKSYQTPIYNVILRVTANREDALDATQSAFLKAYDNLHRFDTSRKFFSWICRIGVNEALNAIRKNRRLTPLETEVRETAANPEHRLRDSETQDMLLSALRSLQPDYRVVITLKHFHGLSYREISAIVGVPVKTVKSRLFTARRTLRDVLIQEGLLR